MTRSFESTVLLSHNSLDKPAVEAIKGRLESALPPILCWFDKDDLRSQGTWLAQIEEVLTRCEAAALFYGPHGLGPVHDGERQLLLTRAMQQPDTFRLIPVLLPGSAQADVTGFAKLHNWVDFTAGLDSPAATERLVALIRGEAPRQTLADDLLPAELEPYRGLERFDGQHADFFFGRDEEIGQLCRCIQMWPFVAVIGGSGSGKSSLVRAGLQTQQALEQVPQLQDAVRITVLPGSNPLRALADQVAAAMPSEEAMPSEDAQAPEAIADALENRFRERPDGLLTLLSSRFPREDQFVLVIIDQFEELFTHQQNASEDPKGLGNQTTQFVHLLQAIHSSGQDRLRVVITLRADFFDRCLQVPSLVPLVQNHQLLLGELSHEAFHEVIIRPAQQAGAYFEKGLVPRIMADVEGQHGSLPLLEHALKELWARRQGRWLTNEAYDETGGVAGALQKRADDTLRSLRPEQREIAKNLFLRLTTLGEGVSDTRRRVQLQELYPADKATHAAVEKVIDRLRSKKSRLIVTNDDGTTEVTHESLMQQWGQLRTWLDENREEKRLQDRLRDAAHEWLETCPEKPDQRDSSYLWDGGRLDDAKQFDRKRPAVLNKLEQAFLAASIAKREREDLAEEHRRQRELRLAQEREAEAQARAKESEEATRKQEELTQLSRRRTRWALLALGLALLGGSAAALLGIQAKRAGDTARTAQTTALEALTMQLEMFAEPTEIAGEIAAAVSRRERAEVDAALGKLTSSETPYAQTASISSALEDLQRKIDKWAPDEKISWDPEQEPSSERVRQAVLHFAETIRAAWESQDLDENARALSRSILVQPTYERAIQVTRKIAAGSRDPRDLDEFERLYWSELVFLETPAVATSMVHFRKTLRGDPGYPPSELPKLAAELKQKCDEALMRFSPGR